MQTDPVAGGVHTLGLTLQYIYLHISRDLFSFLFEIQLEDASFVVAVLSTPLNLLYEGFVSLFAKAGAETHMCLVK